MGYINPVGDPAAPIYMILERPFSSDEAKGTLCSGGIGFALKKMLEEAGIPEREVFFVARFPDTENPLAASTMLDNALQGFRPPLILLVGEAAGFYLPDLRRSEGQESWKTQMNKYVGSLLRSPAFNFPHYAIPLKDPSDLMKDWSERNVTTYVDLGKVKDELSYWRRCSVLQPLRCRDLFYNEMETDEVLAHIDSLRAAPAISEDIETVYPKKGSEYYGKHPGMPVTFGLAASAEHGVSFSIFRETPAATKEVWKAFARLHEGGATIIGQNFFNFDSYFYSMLGFQLRRECFSDTLIRHHILWPGLSHKLQFMTRQYTRQPYYKDEGKTWNMKNMSGLRHYNCLDATVTYEVWEGQEEEFKQREYLR